MAEQDLVAIRLRLSGQEQVQRGARSTATAISGIGNAARGTSTAARGMGSAVESAAGRARRGLSGIVSSTGLLQAGIVGSGLAFTKWGLGFNAQLESARERFRLFTNDVDGLMKAVSAIDRASQFNFADLADSAALLGNSGVRDIPKVLQGAANAAAASGKGGQALQSIVIALSQIQSKGRLSQEEINQLNEAGAPGAQRTIARAFNLTAKQLQNLGGQGLDARKAVQALTNDWTSGRMANAAQRQIRTLGGQWDHFTGDMQKLSGKATESLAHSLERRVIPAADRAVSAITKIFGTEGLSNEQKLRRARRVIDRELGPIATDLLHQLDRADIPQHLGDLVGQAAPKIAAGAAKAGPRAASAFLDAWLHSGPWGQIGTILFAAWKGKGLINKLLGDPLHGAARRGGAGGGILASAKPVPVFVTNPGGLGGGGGTPVPAGGPGERAGRGRFGRVGRLAGAGARALPVIGAGLLARDIAKETPLERYSGSKGWGNLAHDIGGLVSGLVGRHPHRISGPGASLAPRTDPGDFRGRSYVPGAYASPSMAIGPRRRGYVPGTYATPAPRPQPINLHVAVTAKMDARESQQALVRVTRQRDARG